MRVRIARVLAVVVTAAVITTAVVAGAAAAPEGQVTWGVHTASTTRC
jgi:hypothetical protein